MLKIINILIFKLKAGLSQEQLLKRIPIPAKTTPYDTMASAIIWENTALMLISFRRPERNIKAVPVLTTKPIAATCSGMFIVKVGMIMIMTACHNHEDRYIID